VTVRDWLTLDERRSAGESETSAPRAASRADVVLALQRRYGNRRVARDLSARVRRQPITKQAPAPPSTGEQTTSPNKPIAPKAPAKPEAVHLSWVEQTTVPNKPIATELDALETFSNDELLRKRDELALKASVRLDDKHAQYERSLEAAEFLASRRGIAPLKYADPYHFSDQHAIKRRNVRAVLEQGVRETGSLKKSIAGMHVTNDVRDDVEFFEKEAAAFGVEFTNQARDIARKMLAQSIDQILGTLERYGLRRESAIYSANQIIHKRDVDDVVKELVNFSGAWEKEPDNPTGDKSKYGRARKWRISLGQHARSLKKKQEIVHDRRKAVAATSRRRGTATRTSSTSPGTNGIVHG